MLVPARSTSSASAHSLDQVQGSPDPEKLWQVSYEPRDGAAAKVEGRKEENMGNYPEVGLLVCPWLELTQIGPDKREGGACRTRKAGDRTENRGRTLALTDAGPQLQT